MNARRGACPALFTPMQTGDGLLARIAPADRVTPAAFVRLCETAERHGNGTIEISARGSLQVRGLSPQSASLFASDVDQLGVATHGVPIITDPLVDDPTSLINAAAIAAALRAAIEDAAIALAPKVSVIVDGGGRLHLDEVAADVRLRAIVTTNADSHLHVALAGNAATATPLGTITANAAVDAVVEILRVIAARGDARAADVLRSDGLVAFDNIASLRRDAPPPAPRAAAEAVGLHPLRNDRFALGVALSFGHASASALADLARAASARGAGLVRPAPGRALLLIGLRHADALALAGDAERIGLIVRPDDPRRRIVACPGKPACASGLIASRMIAAEIARLPHAPALGHTIHISGCRKGCAHPAPAALTIVGTERGCGIIRDGSARAAPRAYIDPANVAAEITRLARLNNEPAHA
jgi:precorrin-3B synthase